MSQSCQSATPLCDEVRRWASETFECDILISVTELARMLVSASNLLGIKIVILENSVDCPGNQINPGGYVKGSFKDPAAIKELASQVDVITAESNMSMSMRLKL